MEAVRRKIRTAGELCGALKVELSPLYPGWKPDLNSDALKVNPILRTSLLLRSWRNHDMTLQIMNILCFRNVEIVGGGGAIHPLRFVRWRACSGDTGVPT